MYATQLAPFRLVLRLSSVPLNIPYVYAMQIYGLFRSDLQMEKCPLGSLSILPHFSSTSPPPPQITYCLRTCRSVYPYPNLPVPGQEGTVCHSHEAPFCAQNDRSILR